MKTLNKKSKSVMIVNGRLAGMLFVVVNEIVNEKSNLKLVKYQAPDNGPRLTITHSNYKDKGFEDRVAEDVRIAFSKLIPGIVLWEKDKGYTDRESGQKVKWNRQLAKFYKLKDKFKKVNK